MHIGLSFYRVIYRYAVMFGIAFVSAQKREYWVLYFRNSRDMQKPLRIRHMSDGTSAINNGLKDILHSLQTWKCCRSWKCWVCQETRWRSSKAWTVSRTSANWRSPRTESVASKSLLYGSDLVTQELEFSLEHQTNLKTLDLNDNRISVIENFAHLELLKDFWLRKNNVCLLN